ncbi:MAG: SDR family NAD(P)-dependent oxidoreductase, partial [Aphanizomenon sp.]
MKIAIIGCGYVGYAVSKYWQSNSNLILTVTTTNPQRVPSLETVAQKVVVTLGNDLENL